MSIVALLAVMFGAGADGFSLGIELPVGTSLGSDDGASLIDGTDDGPWDGDALPVGTSLG